MDFFKYFAKTKRASGNQTGRASRWARPTVESLEARALMAADVIAGALMPPLVIDIKVADATGGGGGVVIWDEVTDAAGGGGGIGISDNSVLDQTSVDSKVPLDFTKSDLVGAVSPTPPEDGVGAVAPEPLEASVEPPPPAPGSEVGYIPFDSNKLDLVGVISPTPRDVNDRMDLAGWIEIGIPPGDAGPSGGPHLVGSVSPTPRFEDGFGGGPRYDTGLYNVAGASDVQIGGCKPTEDHSVDLVGAVHPTRRVEAGFGGGPR